MIPPNCAICEGLGHQIGCETCRNTGIDWGWYRQERLLNPGFLQPGPQQFASTPAIAAPPAPETYFPRNLSWQMRERKAREEAEKGKVRDE